jgi:glycosyltransferase involved in cell wall biosynthesis
MTEHVTVIVCTRDRPRELERCLTALGDQDHANFGILVVDNGSVDGIAELCRARGAACIREPLPGLTRARNLGARASRSRIVAYIDDDAIAEPGWLSALVRPFADPEVAAVAGRTQYMKSRGETLEMTAECAAGDGRDRPSVIVDRSTQGWFALACFGGIGDGNTMAFRRHLLTNSVRFDERIGRGKLIDGGDEHVAFMSLISDGHRVAHVAEAVVRHPTPSSDAARRAKRHRDLRSSIAYILFLYAQFPRHRRDIAAFLQQALLRRTRRTSGDTAPPALHAVDALPCLLHGCRLYWRARKEWSAPRIAGGAATPRVVTLR